MIGFRPKNRITPARLQPQRDTERPRNHLGIGGRFDRSRDITDFGARRFPLIAVVAGIIDSGHPDFHL
jgi:hypothetical protein